MSRQQRVSFKLMTEPDWRFAFREYKKSFLINHFGSKHKVTAKAKELGL